MRMLLPPLLLVTALAAQAPKLELAVLYAGVPDSPRAADWREFLAPRTARFTAIAVADFTEDAAAAADLVILDCPDPIVRDANGKPQRIAVPRPGQLTAAFARPTIVVGGMALLTDGLDLKSNWL